jgi:MFS family permease
MGVAASGPAPREPVPLRRNRDFQLLWGGQAVSLLGSQTSKIAYPLLVLAMTGSPAKAGIASFAAMLGYLLFPLPAGGLADRHDRKRIMIACDAVQTYRMQITPNELLGRTSSVAVQIAWGVIPLGSLLAGFLLQAVSPATAMTVVAAGMTVTAVAATALAPVRDAGRRTPGTPGAAAAQPAG